MNTAILLGIIGGVVVISLAYIFVICENCTSIIYDPDGGLQMNKNVGEEPGKKTPTVKISAPLTGEVGKEIVFRSTGTHQGDAKIAKYLWSFLTEGINKEGETVTYQFSKSGLHAVALTVTDIDGLDGTQDHTINIQKIPEKIDSKPPQFLPVKDIVIETSSEMGEIITYEIPVAVDNVGVVGKPQCDPLSGEHFFLGSTKVICEVFDATGNKGTTSFNVIIIKSEKSESTPPIARIEAPKIAPVNTLVTFSGENSFDNDGEILRYRWVFDDDWKDDKSHTIQREFDIPKTYVVTLTVFDNEGMSGIWEEFIEIQPNPGVTKVELSNIRSTDAFGNFMDAISVGQQIQIVGDLKNLSEQEQGFAFVIEIQDDEGKPVSIAWITGTLSAGQSFSPLLSWIPEIPGKYKAIASTWDAVDNPTIISDKKIITLEVA